MTITRIAGCAVMLWGILSGSAAAAALSKEYDACMAKADTSIAFSVCATAEIKRQETRLSVAWKTAVAIMRATEFTDEPRPPEELPSRRFLEGQRAWIRFKDSACEFYLATEFGSKGRLDFGVCKAEIVADRVDWLESVISELKSLN